MQQEQPQKPINRQNHQATNHQQVITFDQHQGGSVISHLCGQTGHPIVAGLHICFKIGHFFLYIMLPLLTNEFNMLAFVVVAAAVDFWFVKNIAGRLMVGMRWWIEYSQEGVEYQRFEHRVDQRQITSTNQTMFWWPIYLSLLGWFVLIVLNVIAWNPPHIFMCIFCFGLGKYNLNAFSRCYKTKSDNLTKAQVQFGIEKLNSFNKGTIISQIRE